MTKKLITLTLAASLLAACSKDDGKSSEQAGVEEDSEIRLNADVWQMIEGTRATMYDGGTLTSGSFTAAAYVANTTTSYINPVQVNYETDKWVWSDGKHYWPATGNLDFFAYMPATKPTYITVGPTYTANHNVTFNCTDLNMNTDNKTDQGASGVALNFKHPFARIKMQWADYVHSAITSYTIKFKNIKNNGSCTFNGTTSTWTPSGGNTDLTVTSLDDYGAASPTYYLVIPQDWAGVIEVTASWNDWGDTPVEHTLTTTVATNWQPGYSYTYTFNISPDDLTVDTSNFTEQWKYDVRC